MSCHSDCIKDTHWYEFGKRKACKADCDLAAFQVQAEAALAETEASQASTKWIIPGLIFIAILLLIAKYKKWI